MKTDFELWARGRSMIVYKEGFSEFANSEAQLLWEAWSEAWNLAIRLQRAKDEKQIDALKKKIETARKALS
jgi:hypothetical protein